MSDNQSVTSIQTIVAIVLKELRVERGIHQAQLADHLSKSASAIAKLESGQTALGLDIFYTICAAHNVVGSMVLAAAERYAQMFNASHWIVVRATPDKESLMDAASLYYSSPGFKRRQQMPLTGLLGNNEILNGPAYWGNDIITMPDVFRFALQEDYRNEQLSTTSSSMLAGFAQSRV